MFSWSYVKNCNLYHTFVNAVTWKDYENEENRTKTRMARGTVIVNTALWYNIVRLLRNSALYRLLRTYKKYRVP